MMQLIIIIATIIGLFGCNPSSSEVQQDPAPSSSSEVQQDQTPQSSLEDQQDPAPAPTLTSQHGYVAAGYLAGANVCLDLNSNKACDYGEPFTKTTENGSFNLEATQTQFEEFNILVEVTVDTVDEDTGTTVEKAYTLTTPVGKSYFISPITTLVQSELDNYPGIGLNDAEANLSRILRMSEEDLYDDFIQNSSLERMHLIAQVVANALGDALQAFELRLDEIGVSDSEKFTREITLIATQAITDNLKDIQIAVVTAEEIGEISINAISTAVLGEDIRQLSTSLKEQIANKTALASAVIVTPKSTYVDGMTTTFIGLSKEHQNNSSIDLVGYSLSTDYLNEKNEILTKSCEKEWDISNGTVYVNQCDTESYYLENKYKPDQSRWLSDSSNELIKITYDQERSTKLLIDDSTTRYTTTYLFNDQIVDAESYDLSSSAFSESLAGKKIQDHIKKIIENQYDPTNYAPQEIIDIVINSSNKAVFTEAAKAYNFYITKFDLRDYFFDNFSVYLFDSNGKPIDRENKTVDSIISNNYRIRTFCDEARGSDESCQISLNSNAGDLAGTATLIKATLIYEPIYNADPNMPYEFSELVSETILRNFKWKKSTRFGKDALVFDRVKFLNSIDLSALIEFAPGSFLINFKPDLDGNNKSIRFNTQTADEMIAVIEANIALYIAAQAQ